MQQGLAAAAALALTLLVAGLFFAGSAGQRCPPPVPSPPATDPSVQLSLRSLERRVQAAEQRAQELQGGANLPPAGKCSNEVTWRGGCSGSGRSEHANASSAAQCVCECERTTWCDMVVWGGAAHSCELRDASCIPVVAPAAPTEVRRSLQRRRQARPGSFKCLLMYSKVDFTRRHARPAPVQRRAMLEIAEHVARGCDETAVYMSVNLTDFDLDELEADLKRRGVGLERLALRKWPEEIKNLWEKEYTMWVRALERDLHRFEYFVKIEADTMFVGSNFRKLLKRNLAEMDADAPNFLGPVAFNRNPTPVILSNYILNRGALRRLGPALRALSDGPRLAGRTIDRRDEPFQLTNRGDWPGCEEIEAQDGDFQISRCLAHLGVAPSRQLYDELGREYFFSCTMVQRKELPTDPSFWFWNGRPYKFSGVKMCCAEYPVMTHLHKDACKLLAMHQVQASVSKDEITGDFMRRIEHDAPVPAWCVPQ